MQELISVYVVRVDFMVNLGSTNTVVILRETEEKCDKLNLRGQSPPLL